MFEKPIASIEYPRPNQMIHSYSDFRTVTFPRTLQCITNMILEHFRIPHTSIYINYITDLYDNLYKLNNHNILYNWEHYFGPTMMMDGWRSSFQRMLEPIDTIWDFNVENYMYLKSIGRGKDFRFAPPRYTTWFEQFIIPNESRKYLFDLFFTGVLNSDIRLSSIKEITQCIHEDGLNFIPFKFCMMTDNELKYHEMQTCKYVIDIPRIDEPETINVLRIYEAICLNMPVIVYDKYNIGSDKYFPNLIIKMDVLRNADLRKIVSNQPQANIAEIFKELTYTDEAYEKYRQSIVEDFYNKTKIMIPDTVLMELK